MWRKYKRFVQAAGPLRTHIALAEATERAMAIFGSAMDQGEELQDRATHSLMAPWDCLDCTQPMTPDSWMLQADGRTIRRPGGRQVYISSIPTILQKSQLADGAACPRLSRGEHDYMLMALGRPRRVPQGMLAQVVVTKRGTEALKTVLLAQGLLQPFDSPDAPHKLNWQAFQSTWGSHCLCVRRGTRVTCSCFLHCWSGSCPHAFAAEQLWRIRVWHAPLPRPAPRRRAAPDSDDDLIAPPAQRRRRSS
jgi:hypothetical protein